MPGIVDVPGVEVFGKGRAEFALPCGYVDGSGKVHRNVVMRELTGVEEDMMDDDDVSVTERMSNVLAECCVKLGEETDKDVIRRAICDDLAVGLPITSTDRIAMMIFLRRTSMGDVYKFSRRCPVCGHVNKKTLDLRTLEMKSVPDVRAGKRRVEVVLPRSKRRAIMRVLTAKYEAKLTGLRPQQKDLKSLSILARVESIEVDTPKSEAEGGGVKTVMKQLDDAVVGLEIIKALPSEDRAYMRQVYDAMEADVDTTVEVGCDNRTCGIDFSFVLDLGQAFFLNPAEEVTAEALNWL